MRNRQIAAYVAFGGITAAGVALAATSFPLLIPFYLALGGRFLGTVRAVKRVNEASVALSNGDALAGRALAEPVAQGVVGARARPRARRAARRDRGCARRQGRAGARARAPRAREAVAAPDPAPVLLLHGDQPADRARPHQGSAPRARGARPGAGRRGAQAVVLDRADAPVLRRGRDPDRASSTTTSSTIGCARGCR